MGKVAIRAEYKTETVFNEGYICIDGKNIEGVFGLDYIKIDMNKDNFNLMLVEKIYTTFFGMLITGIRKRNFISQQLYYPEICCPKQYLLFSKDDNLSLSLLELEHSQSVIRDVYERLNQIRPETRGAV